MDIALPRPGNGQRHCLTAWVLAALLSGLATSSLAAPKPQMHTVEIDALQFSPPTLEVKAGDTVIWKNKDAFPHNVSAESKRFRSGNIQSGQSWMFKAGNTGVFPYVCTLHPGMKAVLIVK